MTQQELDNLSWLPTVTYEQFLDFDPCWLDDEEKAAQLKEIGSRKEKWSAVDVLQLVEVSVDDRMWSVLREDFLPANLLHEYACRCADYALSKIDNPDPRSIRAVEAKRKWLRGEITDEELAAAWDAAWDAARAAAWDAARAAAWKELLEILIALIKEPAHDAGTSTSGKQNNTTAIVTGKERKING